MRSRRQEPITRNWGPHMVRPRADAVTILTAYGVLLYAVPAEQGIAALGSLGSPAVLVGIGAGIWWCWHQLHRRSGFDGTRPPLVRPMMFVFLFACLASYVAAATRALPTVEVSPADTGVLRTVSWLGVFLLACDGIPRKDRFDTLIARLIIAGGIFAALGLLQFVTGQSIIGGLSIPGLTAGIDAGIQNRSGFVRSAATAAHPLEYAVVLCMILPLALARAMHAPRGHRFWRWLPVAAMALAAGLSVSRSAMLGLLAVLVVLVPTWPRIARRFAIAIAATSVVAIWILLPGFVSTVQALFVGASNDTGVTSRTGSYDLAAGFVIRNPLFGRGFGTFLPQYRILDNQYLLLLIDGGIVGLAALLAVLVAALVGARDARRAARSNADRAMGQSLMAAVFAGATLFAFFDALSFSKAGGTMFLVIGLVGAFWRFMTSPEYHRDNPSLEHPGSRAR